MSKKDDLMLEVLLKLSWKMDEQSEVNKMILDKLNEKPLPTEIDQDTYINNMEQNIKSMPSGVQWYKILLWVKDNTWYESYDHQPFQHMTFKTLDELHEYCKSNQILSYKYNTIRN